MKKLLKDCFYIFFIVALMFFITDLPSFSRTVKFVQLSDVHFAQVQEDTSYKLLSKTRPLLEDAVKQINCEKKVDFVIITGDLIDKPQKDSLYAVSEILNTMNYPWYFAMGNHDTTTSGFLTKAKYVEILKEVNPNYKFDSTYYTFKPKPGFRVIVLDGAKNKGISSNGKITQEQLCWLDELLAESKNDVVLIFLHFPLLPPYDAPAHKILNDNEFKAVLDKYKMPIAIFSGHYHAAKITKRGNILHVSSPTLAGYPNSFRVITVDNKFKKVIFKFDFHETNLKDLQKKTKILTLGGKIYYGRPQDRNNIIIMDK